jgi:hypothetical protein
MTEKLLLDDRYLGRSIPRRSRPAADARSVIGRQLMGPTPPELRRCQPAVDGGRFSSRASARMTAGRIRWMNGPTASQ